MGKKRLPLLLALFLLLSACGGPGDPEAPPTPYPRGSGGYIAARSRTHAGSLTTDRGTH